MVREVFWGEEKNRSISQETELVSSLFLSGWPVVAFNLLHMSSYIILPKEATRRRPRAVRGESCCWNEDQTTGDLRPSSQALSTGVDHKEI